MVRGRTGDDRSRGAGLRFDRIVAVRFRPLGCAERADRRDLFADRTFVLGSARPKSNVAAGAFPFPRFHRREFADAFSVQRTRGDAVLSAVKPDSSARLHGDSRGSGAASFYFNHVCSVALVGRTGVALRSQTSFGYRPDHCRGRFRSVHGAGRWRQLLEQIFTRDRRARSRNGNQRCAVNDHGHERGRRRSRRNRIGNQQCRFARGRFAGHCRARHCDVARLRSFARRSTL